MKETKNPGKQPVSGERKTKITRKPTLSQKHPSVYSVILFLLVALLPVAIYIHTIQYTADKLDEDNILLKHHTLLSDPGNLTKILTTDAFFGDPPSGFYRPLQNFSFYSDTLIFGGDIYGYRITALLLHILTCFGLFFLLYLTGIEKKLSLLFALVFAAHPLFVHSVVWLPSKGDLLLGLMSVISLIFLTLYRKKNTLTAFILHGVFFALAVCSKESAMLLPLVYLLFWKLALKGNFIIKSALKFIALYSAVTILFLFARNAFLTGGTADQMGIRVLIHNLRVFPEVFGKFFFPMSLSPMPAFSLLNTVIGVFCVGGMIAGLILLRKRKEFPMMITGILFFTILTLPGMAYRHGMADIGYDYLEQRTYLPAVGVILLLAGILAPVYALYKKQITAVLCAIIFVMAVVSFRYSKTYENAETFYSYVAEKNPQCAMAFNNLGTLAAIKGNNTKALELFDKSIRAGNNNYLAFYNRGRIRDKFGEYKDAVEDYSRAISLKPDYAVLYNNRGASRGQLTDYEGAFNDLSEAIRLNPSYSKAYFNRGVVLMMANQTDRACSDWKKAESLGEKKAVEFLKEKCGRNSGPGK